MLSPMDVEKQPPSLSDGSLSLKACLKRSVIEAMKAKDAFLRDTIRLIQSAVLSKEKESADTGELTDDAIISILEQMIRQRRMSVEQYELGGRPAQAQKERDEIAVIQTFLPAPLSAEALTLAIEAAMIAVPATSVRDMGKIMEVLKPQIQGRVEMKEVSQQIRARLDKLGNGV